MKFRYLYIFSMAAITVIMIYVLLRPPAIDLQFEGSYIRTSGRISKIEESNTGTYIYISNITSFYYADGSDSAAFIPKGIIFITNNQADTLMLKKGYFVTLSGKYSVFNEATNLGQFDKRLYYRTLGIEGKIEKGVINSYSRGSIVEEKLFDLKKYLKVKIQCLYPKEEGQVVEALLIGDKVDFPEETRELYKQAGISHILSVSSLHITVLGMAFFGLFLRLNLSHKTSAFITIPIVIMFCITIDGSLSARRAVFMFTCKMAAVILGRTYDSRTAVSTSALVTLIKEPYLLYNSSFWMSYGCVFAVLLLYPLIKTKKKYFSNNVLGDKLLEPFKVGLCILVGTMPIVLWFYYEISFWGLLLNLLILPCMSICLIGGLTGILLPYKLLPVSRFLSAIICLMLRLFNNLCRVTDLTKLGCISFGRPSKIQIIIWIVIWILVIGIKKIRDRLCFKKFMLLSALVTLILIIPHDFTPKVTFLDVGQGDSIVIQNSNRNVYIIDGGSSSSYTIGKNVIIPYLKYMGFRKVDGIFLSHPDADHCNGIMELLNEEQIRIEKIIIACNTYEVWMEKYPQLFSLCMNRNIPIRYIEKGLGIRDENMQFYCMHPEKDTGVSAENKDSQVLLFSAFGHTMLFTGDLEGDGERKTIEAINELAYYTGVDVLKVAHHGSKNSTSDEFLIAVNPELAVISVGAKNLYGHPSPATLDRLTSAGVTYLRTDVSGAITITLN